MPSLFTGCFELNLKTALPAGARGRGAFIITPTNIDILRVVYFKSGLVMVRVGGGKILSKHLEFRCLS